MQAIIVSGGRRAERRVALPENALVICADSGLESAETLGLRPDLIVGDLDSVDPVALAAARAAGVEVEQHPVDKDATDLELALAAARERGAERVVVVSGGPGERIDHFVAELALLASDGGPAEALVGGARIQVLRGPASADVSGEPGGLVSLVTARGDARGVTTHGLRWPLEGETLRFGTTRGVSNELVGERATVMVAAGVLLVIQP
jgi:thiamine pyrophosphokinase